MKLRLLAAAVAALTLGSGAVLAQTAPAAAPAPATPAADKATLSYALGYEYGSNLAEMKADVDINTVVRALQDGYAKREPTLPGDKLAAALKQFEQKVAAQQKAEFERVTRENKAKSEAFLLSNKTKTGVTVLPSGIQYRIIEAGTGAKPTAASTVQLHLRGSLSSGQEFANTYNTPGAQPAEVKMSEFPGILPPSLKEVLQMMGAGSRWEIFLPSSKAWGDDPRSPVGPGQAVVFDIKLVSVK